jgi:Do/DeqQ family serine protease
MLRIVFAVLVLLGCVGSLQAETTVPKSRVQVQMSFAPIVKRAAPAVVNVYAKSVQKQEETGLMADPFFRRFFGEDGNFGRPKERVASSLGSGVIVDASGYIVTNNHVIANATDIRVALSDRREFEAKLLLADERTDLAVLKIDAGDEKLPILALSDSDELEVGDLVLAIGNPFGVGQTVTSGIVSALARTQVGITDYQFFIQTDAAINPGNSGGALVDMNGGLVGINTAIFSKSGGSIGIGFSIPSNMVKTVVASAEGGSNKVKRPWLGVELQDVTPDVADSLGFARPEGTLVVKLHPASPLLAAGLKRGDVIVAIDGKAVDSAQEFGFRVGTSQIGETRIVEYRRGSESFETRFKLIAAPETVLRDESVLDALTPLAGLTVANLSPAVAEEVGLTANATGVVAISIKPGAPAELFKRGDVVFAVNGVAIATVADLKTALASRQRRWTVSVLRGNRKLLLKYQE